MQLKHGFRQFLLRLSIFIALSFGIPYLMQVLTASLGLGYTVRFSDMKFPIFSLVVIAAFIVLKRHELFELEPYKNLKKQTSLFIVCSLISYLFYFMFMYTIQPFKGFLLTINFIFIYGSLLLGTLCLALAVFNLRFFRKFYQSIVMLLIVTGFFFGLTLIIRESWTLFSFGISYIVLSMLKLSYNDVALVFDSNGFPGLRLEEFQVGIGAPCSGIDSLSLFISFFTLVLLLDWSKIDKKKAGIFFVLGSLGMYLVSILRIYVLMIIGRVNPKLSLGLFHENLGWLFFVVYILAAFYLGYPWFKTKQ